MQPLDRPLNSHRCPGFPTSNNFIITHGGISQTKRWISTSVILLYDPRKKHTLKSLTAFNYSDCTSSNKICQTGQQAYTKCHGNAIVMLLGTAHQNILLEAYGSLAQHGPEPSITPDSHPIIHNLSTL